jgi:hypothetical protein
MDIFDMLDHNGRETVFHGVRSATLSKLVSESEDGNIHLYGRSSRDWDDEDAASHIQNGGYLYVTDYKEIDFSANEFCDDGGVILVLGAKVSDPEIVDEAAREHVIRLDEWEVIGGVRPAFDPETGDLDEENWEILSLEEVLA